MTDNPKNLAKNDFFLLAGAILLTVMTWFTVGKGLPLDEASVGPASRALGSETRDAFKKQSSRNAWFYSERCLRAAIPSLSG